MGDIKLFQEQGRVDAARRCRAWVAVVVDKAVPPSPDSIAARADSLTARMRTATARIS